MEDALSVEHFADICRFCLIYESQENPQYPLFLHQGQYGRYVKDVNESLPEIIANCLGFKIDPDDGLPLNICAACETSLTASNRFRNRCIRANETLLEVKSNASLMRPATNKNECAEGQIADNIAETEELIPDPSYECISIVGELSPTAETRSNHSDEEEQAQSTEYVVDYEHEINPEAVDNDDGTRFEEDVVDFELPADDDVVKQESVCPYPEQPEQDSDEEYERDLADKYESLDQSYHIAEAPSLPAIATTATSAPFASQSPSSNRPQAGGKRATSGATDPDAASSKKARTNRNLLAKQCYVCGVIVTRMRDHMKCHPGELQFKCEMCDRSYLTKTGRDRHMDGQHPESRIIVDPDGTVIENNRAHQKRMQQRLRYAGKEFVHRNGLVQGARHMRAACNPSQCRFKCAKRLAEQHRQRSFDEYYALADLSKQWQYLALHCDRTVPKVRDKLRDERDPEGGSNRGQRRPEDNGAAQPVKEGQKKRQNNIRYFLYGDAFEQADGGEEAEWLDDSQRHKIFVCKSMFLATFDIGETSVATALQKTDVAGNLIDFDRRGYRR